MKSTTTSRWLKLLAWLLVPVIIVMLLIPKELTDEQLAQVKPGMRIVEVKQLLGQENGHGAFILSHSAGGYWSKVRNLYWSKERKWWKPSLLAIVDGEAIASLSSGGCFWFADNYLLVVEHHDGLVTKTWLFPITRTGGGLQGCIDTIKEYWNQWRSK